MLHRKRGGRGEGLPFWILVKRDAKPDGTLDQEWEKRLVLVTIHLDPFEGEGRRRAGERLSEWRREERKKAERLRNPIHFASTRGRQRKEDVNWPSPQQKTKSSGSFSF